jgi:hypothetical protein
MELVTVGLKCRNQDRHGIRKKKGSLEETISYSIYNDDPTIYSVFYRDKDTIKRANLKEFIESDEYSAVPLTRINLISKKGKIVWKKGQKEILIKN